MSQRRRRLLSSVAGTCQSCTMTNTKTTIRRNRKRRPRPLSFGYSPNRRTSTKTTTPVILLSTLQLLTITINNTTHAAIVTWSNGPEDKYFCGYAWDDPDCASRQNCRSGRSEDCEGHLSHGVECFANTDCDTKFGGAAAFIEGRFDDLDLGVPTVYPTEVLEVDFDSLVDGLFTPTSSPVKPGGPTVIPTEVPIGAPPDFVGLSDEPRDHWYCGIGIEDASSKCMTHCPQMFGCPMGEICYFGTRCDARTHMPTPPPTRRPTGSPTTVQVC